MALSQPTVRVPAILKQETNGAYLFTFDEENDVWVPKQHGEWHPDDGEAELEEWIALNEGLI